MRNPSMIVLLALGVPAALQARDVAPIEVAQQARFIDVAGGRNFRDVGGYATADGHHVRWGRLYRSGSLGSLTPAGQQTLTALHVGSIIDLRSTAERARDPGNWLAASGQGYWSRDYAISQGDMARVFGDPTRLTAEAMRAMMLGSYRTLPYEQAPGYRELFARLVAGKGPVVVNCTAGKDRTGIAVALVLTAIGVPYDAVRDDFLLSNGAPGMDGLQRGLSGPLAKLPADVAAPLIGVEPLYLDAAFAAMREKNGSVEAYLRDELGVGANEIALLRRRMLVR
jgi:protein-tyrosine phosphatase